MRMGRGWIRVGNYLRPLGLLMKSAEWAALDNDT